MSLRDVYDRKVLIWTLTGEKFGYSLKQHCIFFRRPTSIGIFLLIPLFMAIATPFHCLPAFPIGSYGYWLIGICIYHLFSIVFGLSISYLTSPPTIIMFVVSSTSAVFATFVMHESANRLLDPEITTCLQWSSAAFASNIVIANLMETMLIYALLHPHLLKLKNNSEGKGEPAEQPIDQSDQSALRLATALIPVTDLKLITARGHLLKLILKNDEKVIRSQLKVALSQLDPELGLQPHRSYWVAGEFLAKAKLSQDKPIMVCTDGRVIPVSKQRIEHVQDWLEKYRPDLI